MERCTDEFKKWCAEEMKEWIDRFEANFPRKKKLPWVCHIEIDPYSSLKMVVCLRPACSSRRKYTPSMAFPFHCHEDAEELLEILVREYHQERRQD